MKKVKSKKSRKIIFTKNTKNTKDMKDMKDINVNHNWVLLFFKGVLMGLFDLVPGISGGTMALITGIYEYLIKEINNVFDFFKNIFSFNRKKILNSWNSLNKIFLITLISGIVTGIVISVFVLSFFLKNFFAQTMGLITGIIFVSSIVLIKKYVKSLKNIFVGFFGLLIGVLVSILSPLQGHEFGFVQIFFLGVFAIVAMILPGISGSLILLLLGGYEFMIFSLRNLFSNLDVVLIFLLGAFFGLGLFSKLISYLLKRHHDRTMSFLSCLMLGAITKPILDIVGVDSVIQAFPFFILVLIVSFFILRN